MKSYSASDLVRFVHVVGVAAVGICGLQNMLWISVAGTEPDWAFRSAENPFSSAV